MTQRFWVSLRHYHRTKPLTQQGHGSLAAFRATVGALGRAAGLNQVAEIRVCWCRDGTRGTTEEHLRVTGTSSVALLMGGFQKDGKLTGVPLS